MGPGDTHGQMAVSAFQIRQAVEPGELKEFER